MQVQAIHLTLTSDDAHAVADARAAQAAAETLADLDAGQQVVRRSISTEALLNAFRLARRERGRRLLVTVQVVGSSRVWEVDTDGRLPQLAWRELEDANFCAVTFSLMQLL